ncbi:MAG: hypothetical protein QOH70_2105 [Blastocatellia bacterium]|jgi:biotin carboxylase|nr:hypothetical protein [Blastocatellia bacterium]
MEKVLIIAAGQECFKGRFLKELTDNPYEFFLLLSSTTRGLTNDWFHRYINWDHIIRTDFRHPQVAARYVKDWAESRRVHFEGVITYLEAAVLVTQAIAEELSIPPITTGDPIALRSKNIMRREFIAAGLPQPQSIACRSLEDARRAVDQIGLPCVFKPSQMAASVGVRKVCTGENREVEEAYTRAATDDITEEDTRYTFNIAPEIVVEEYIPTYQEISCEGLVQAGKVDLVAVTKKILSPEPYFEELGHVTPFPLDDNVMQMVESQLGMAVVALKLHSTAFHAEFRLRTNLEPVLVEVGARLAGGFIPQLVQLSTGLNMLDASVKLAIGQQYDCSPKSRSTAAIRFFDDESNSRFAVAAARIRAFPFVQELALYGEPGSGRRGHVIWTAKTATEIEDAWKTINEIL